MCYDKQTRKARGFGFINFDSEEVADKVLENQFHYLKGTKVETTKAKPRSSMDSGGWGHRSSATFIPWSGPYLVPYPYLYAPPGIMNYGYMMNQTGTDTGNGIEARISEVVGFRAGVAQLVRCNIFQLA